MGVLKRYNSVTSLWEPILIGEPGPPGASDDALPFGIGGVLREARKHAQVYRTGVSAATRSLMDLDTLSDGSKWIGGVLGPDGKIYGIPYSATDILIIDPVAGTATRSALGATLTGTIKWGGGVLGPDGKIYGIPFNATDIFRISHPSAPPFTAATTRHPALNKY